MSVESARTNLAAHLILVRDALNEAEGRARELQPWVALLEHYLFVMGNLVNGSIRFTEGDRFVEDQFRALQARLPQTVHEVLGLTKAEIGRLCEAIDGAADSILDQYSDDSETAPLVENVRGILLGARSRRFSLDAVQEVQRAEASAKEAAGSAARSELAATFEGWGDSEKSRPERGRWRHSAPCWPLRRLERGCSCRATVKSRRLQPS